MGRLAAVILALVLLAGLVWAGRRSSADGDRNKAVGKVTVDARWVEAHQRQLRRLLDLAPKKRLEFKEAQPSAEPDYYQVTLEVVDGDQRRPLELYISHDGERVFYYDQLYQLDDPFLVNRLQLRLEESPARGPADAPVTVVEYVDYSCGYCRRFFLTQEKPLLQRYQGKVRLVIKQFPILSPASKEAAHASTCAFRLDKDKFWTLHEKLFVNPARAQQRPALVELAREVGLDTTAFTACLEQPETRAAVQRDFREGERLGVDGTPAFFINGRRVGGLLPTDAFFRIIDEELAAAQPR